MPKPDLSFWIPKRTSFKTKDEFQHFMNGFITAARAFAVWHDGTEYVGAGGYSLRQVIEAIDEIGGPYEQEANGWLPKSEHVFGWMAGGKYYCSKPCAGGGIPFAFIPKGEKCANCRAEIICK